MRPHTNKHSGEGVGEETGGYAQTVPMSTGSGLINPVSLINQPAGFRLAQTFTIEFAINPAPVAADGSMVPVNCQAVVQWVENGNQVQRIITVGNGVSISGTGTGIQVTLYDIPIGVNYVLGRPYQVTGILSPGLRPSFIFLPLLVLPIPPDNVSTFQLPAPGGQVIIPIPQNAGVRAVQVIAVGNGAGNTADVVASAAAGGQSFKLWTPNGTPLMTDLPSGCTSLVITNRSATVDCTITVLWGVDG